MPTFRSHRSKDPPTPLRHVPSIRVQEPPPPPAASSKPGAMSAAFGSKSRRVRFDLHLRILDLNNVPLVSGTSFVKWHLPSSTAAEHRGRTSKCQIRDHRVAYDYDKRLPVRLTVGKDGMLQECPVELEVLQEYSASGRGERIELGNVRLNLAEYVDAADPASPGAAGARDEGAGGEHGIVRRYLMQDSKINSTLKLGIHMRHVEGSRDYFAPPLRTAPVFGGIAGIISSSEPPAPANSGSSNNNNNNNNNNTNPNAGANNDDAGTQEPLPNLSTRSKEIGEMQDMYRRTLAAFWASQPGELKADECIEDIFAGGNGWAGKQTAGSDNRNNNNHNNNSNNNSSSTGDNRRHSKDRDRADSHSRGGSGASTPKNRDVDGVEVTGRGEGRVHAQGNAMLALGRPGRKNAHASVQGKGPREVDEADVREDLTSWRVGSEKAFA